MGWLNRDQWCIIVYRNYDSVVQVVGPFKSEADARTEKESLHSDYTATVTRMDTQVWR